MFTHRTISQAGKPRPGRRLKMTILLAASAAAGLTLAGVTIAGVAASAAPRTAGSASPRATAPPPVDHQLCYTASGTQFKIPAGVRLVNQFSPNGFVPKISPGLVVHCNPVAKTLPTGKVFPITNPNAHLACFTIAAPTAQPTPEVVVTNQFGSAELQPSQPNLLCVPSWKSLTGPPGKTPTTPPGLNHFTCYPVKVVSGHYTPPAVMLQDEFAKAPVNAEVNPVPVELCLPTEKIIGKKVFPIINPTMHLLCFPVTKTPIIPTVWDENQFGTSVVKIKATTWLCPPSTKKIVG
jgi:hypothetical protein